MDPQECDRALVESILIKYTEIPYAYGEFHTEAVFDRLRERRLKPSTPDGMAATGSTGAW